MTSETSVKDPVCGMNVNPTTAGHRHKHDGRTYYFCSAGCREKFIAASTEYLAGHKPSQSAPTGSQWTCPMHPEVLRDEPGDCPKCGMALEPVMPTATPAPNPELASFKRRLWLA